MLRFFVGLFRQKEDRHDYSKLHVSLFTTTDIGCVLSERDIGNGEAKRNDFAKRLPSGKKSCGDANSN